MIISVATLSSTPSRVFLLRVASAIASAAAFGLLAAPVLSLPHLPAAFVLAFCFGFFFVGGTGYRILLAVALRDAARHTAASWTGATAASSLAALAAAIVLATLGRDDMLLLAAYALAINVAYLPVKLACLGAGCCVAGRPLAAPGGRRLDLRWLEIGLTLAALLVAFASLAGGAPSAAAILGLFGHMAVRLLSRWARRRMPHRVFSANGTGQEFAPLTLALVFTVGIAGCG